jgi:predicted transcriptional regulator of viral defense system
MLAEKTRIVADAAGDVDLAERIKVALRMGSGTLLQRLGFLADLADWSMPAGLRGRLRSAIPTKARATFGRPERRVGDVG